MRRAFRTKRRALVTGAAVAAAAALALAGCSSGSSGNKASGSQKSSGNQSQNKPADHKASASPTPSPKPAADVSISPQNAPMNPTDPIVVKVDKGTLKSVVVTSPQGKQVSGAYGADKTTWSTNEPLGYAKAYAVSADAVAKTGGAVHRTGTVHTLSPQAQAYPSFIPPPSETDVGVGQPIVVRFDHPIADKAATQKRLQVTSTPAQAGAWYWISNTEVHYRPEKYWQPGTTIKMHAAIYGVDLGDGVYGQTDRDLTLRVHDSWVAKANGATKRMWVFHNGKLVRNMAISLGTTHTPTHTGIHVISEKSQKVIMDSATYGVKKGQPGYYRESVFWDERISNDGEFVHAAPWSTGQQGASNVSHGCVNLSVPNAQWFYAHFGPGDVVEVSNSGGPQLPVYDTYGDWSVPWSTWSAGNTNS
ncbi:MAG TPA: Ig-like domain-containing protein [Mycobacteriales bacterium]